jgi:predicted ATPase/DNA-binding winged helix-turn-helix (wHTH) protein
LLVDGRPLALGDRAFDVLVALIQARGAVVTKDALLQSAWPGRVVEENSLHVQISALRKALGSEHDLIRTIAGRGYTFTGPIPAREPAELHRCTTNLPERNSELIGREAQIEHVLDLATRYRLISFVGAGGVGKTRLALEVARYLQPRYADGAWITYLAPLSDPELVPASIASLLGLSFEGGAVAIGRIAAAIGPLQALFILDNCEHVAEIAARVCEALLGSGSAVRILATSREPLRADGEYVYRVPSLGVPREGADDIADPLGWGAVRLFVTRVQESTPNFALDQHSTNTVVSICRRLDGIPLAIELAARRAASLGIDELAKRLDNRFDLLTGGNRSALPRQQTLRATLDWSFELLPDVERTIMRRLAIFSGTFSLQAASSVTGSDDVSMSAVVDAMSNLVEKSLVATNSRGSHSGFHLLESMRAYSLEKLGASRELESAARRHAQYYEELLGRAADEWETEHSAEWLAAYRPCIDNVRTALDWAFSSSGDAVLGVKLTVFALPLFFQLSSIDESKSYVRRALGALQNGVAASERLRMQLHVAHGWHDGSALGSFDSAYGTAAGWYAALDIAERLGDTDYQLRALWGLWVRKFQNAEFPDGLKIATRFWETAKNARDGADAPVGERMVGMALHFLGDQRLARHHTEQMLQTYVPPTRRSDVVRFQFDQQVVARVMLARILWLQGFPDQANRVVEGNLRHARSLGHQLSIQSVLVQSACPIALLCGDLDEAERYIDTLLDYTRRRTQAAWHRMGLCFSGILRIRRGDVAGGTAQLRDAIVELRAAGFSHHLPSFLCGLAGAELRAGRFVEALAVIEEAEERAEKTQERWYLPEILRVRGSIELRRRSGTEADAEALFLKSIELAQLQGAGSWELRAAISLARLWKAQGREPHARIVLEPVLQRFTEGFETADLALAAAIAKSYES